MPAPPPLPRKPEARTEKVEDLVDRVRRGLVRVPLFQRALNWEASDVEDLFDSIYRGYPIGSLLFYKKKASAERLEVGPLVVDAPETSEAWWVVDGQQRVTALTACLHRPVPLPTRPSRLDPYVFFFDAANQKFEPPPASGRIPEGWVPLPYLLEASGLSEWVFGWEHGGDEDLRRLVFEAGARIREYPIPLYLFQTEDPKVAEVIYYRVNNTGKTLRWEDVHKALFGGEGPFPATLSDLSAELADVGMGRLGEDRLLTALVALRGKDPTRTLAVHYRREPEFLQDAVQEALPVLRRVLSFLRNDAGIPHLRLLPKSILLDVLTRFFALHADPNPRTRLLLARWFWRTVLGVGIFDDRTLRRRGISTVSDDEEASAQELLGLVRKERPRPWELPPSFDARADGSRIALLAILHLEPRRLADTEWIDVAGLVEKEDTDAFPRILKQSGVKRSRSAANRIIQPKGTRVQKLLMDRVAEHGPEDPVLASHAIDREAAERLRAGDFDGFLARRAETLTEEVLRFSERMAAWDHSDRPSVDHLLVEAGVEL